MLRLSKNLKPRFEKLIWPCTVIRMLAVFVLNKICESADGEMATMIFSAYLVVVLYLLWCNQ